MAWIEYRWMRAKQLRSEGSDDEFDRWLRQVKAEVFEEGWYYASNGKWGSLEPGENPYGDL